MRRPRLAQPTSGSVPGAYQGTVPITGLGSFGILLTFKHSNYGGGEGPGRGERWGGEGAGSRGQTFGKGEIETLPDVRSGLTSPLAGLLSCAGLSVGRSVVPAKGQPPRASRPPFRRGVSFSGNFPLEAPPRSPWKQAPGVACGAGGAGGAGPGRGRGQRAPRLEWQVGPRPGPVRLPSPRVRSGGGGGECGTRVAQPPTGDR